MEGEGGSLTQGSTEDPGIHADRTYGKLLKIHEEKLAKDALTEKRARQLTMKFLELSEEFHGRSQKSDHEKSLQDYEKSTRKLKDASGSNCLVQQMVREEKSQIFALMRDKGISRQEEEAFRKEDRLERQKWIQARAVFERLRAEERQQKLEEKESERRTEAQEKKDQHEAAHHKQLAEQSETKSATRAKHLAVQERINERMRQASKEQHKLARGQNATLSEKADKAEQRKRQELEKVQQAAREKAEQREKKLVELKLKRERQTEAHCKQIIEKAEEVRHFSKFVNDRAILGHTSQSSSDSPSAARRRSALAEAMPEQQAVGTRSKDGARLAPTGPGNDPEQEEKKESTVASLRVSSWSRELNQANTNAAREYVMKCQELQDARQEMYRKKQYKALSKGARLTERADDINNVRLRSLHNMYIAKKPREGQTEKEEPRADERSESPDGSPRTAGPPPPRSARAARGGRRMPCGLCLREYPESGLPGTALKRTVERLRLQAPPPPPRDKRSQLEEPMSARAGESDGLWQLDSELPLCLSCWHFVKIAT